ncbi:acyltransferase family protein [Winogradskyella sp.]|uniref:acyltransferase family protein n=1 Tax=Winogradskyella sp. TaxID=1883156 RepID=UPI003BAA30C3
MRHTPSRNFGLDFVRAIAITLVVASHCTYLLPQFNQQVTDAIRLLGATGVDIFFVLSGYLIGGIILKYIQKGRTRRKDIFHFWKRRWLRTLPNYVLVLLVNFALLFVLDGMLNGTNWTYFLFIQNAITPHPDFFTEAWSLSIEEYAYLILPTIIYMLLGKVNEHQQSKLFFWATSAVILILFLFKIHFYVYMEIESYKDWSAGFRKVIIYRLDAIYYGFILVYLYRVNHKLKKYRNLLFVLGLLLFMALHALIVYYSILPQDNLLFYTVFYLPLISGSIALTFSWFIALKPLNLWVHGVIYISKRSYAIYLVNYSIVLLTLQRYFEPSVSLVFLYLLCTVVLSELLYRFIERPFMAYRERKFPKI